MSHTKQKRARHARRTLQLAIADIALAEEMLGQNQATLKRFAAELSTVRSRLVRTARLLVDESER